MSICVYCRVKEKKLNDEILERAIEDFHYFKKKIARKADKKCITYESMETDEDIISFVSERTFPYNVYESDIIAEYIYEQLLIFDIRKEKSLKDKYEKIIGFCIFLKKQIGSDMLLTSDVYDDICLLEENNIIWSDTFPFKNDVQSYKTDHMDFT